ncbi:MAG TPA: peptide chain release factor N(5)-glutamine methyltransferase [Bacteroidales bacterium]|nr:peptide chain release factor N(5)-glutamine methyltransferase [Bacteroidales bacterium]
MQNDFTEYKALERYVLEHVTGRDRSWLLTHDYHLNADEQERYDDAMRRVLAHEPVQYIFHSADFMGLRLYVDERVLIPRPETTELVQWVLDDYRSLSGARQCVVCDGSKVLTMMDACTGSGCVALALKNANPAWDIHAFDISDEALLVAQHNSKMLQLPITLSHKDLMLWADEAQNSKYDIITANPPYVLPSEAKDMDANVLDYEPHLALFVDSQDPLCPYRALAKAARKHLTIAGCLYAEINPMLAEDTRQVFVNQNFDVEIREDISGKKRMLKAQRLNAL